MYGWAGGRYSVREWKSAPWNGAQDDRPPIRSMPPPLSEYLPPLFMLKLQRAGVHLPCTYHAHEQSVILQIVSVHSLKAKEKGL